MYQISTSKGRQFLITNGQQTLGVALPWAIAATTFVPHDEIASTLKKAFDIPGPVSSKCTSIIEIMPSFLNRSTKEPLCDPEGDLVHCPAPKEAVKENLIQMKSAV